MQVQFQTSGGIAFLPGLAAPTTIDVESLDDPTRRQLDELLRTARFFELPADAPAPAGAADYQTYTISVDTGERRHTVKVTDASATPPLQALIGLLRSLASAQRRAR